MNPLNEEQISGCAVEAQKRCLQQMDGLDGSYFNSSLICISGQ